MLARASAGVLAGSGGSRPSVAISQALRPPRWSLRVLPDHLRGDQHPAALCGQGARAGAIAASEVPLLPGLGDDPSAWSSPSPSPAPPTSKGWPEVTAEPVGGAASPGARPRDSAPRRRRSPGGSAGARRPSTSPTSFRPGLSMSGTATNWWAESRTSPQERTSCGTASASTHPSPGQPGTVPVRQARREHRRLDDRARPRSGDAVIQPDGTSRPVHRVQPTSARSLLPVRVPNLCYARPRPDAEDLPVPGRVDAGGDQAVHVHGAAALADLPVQRVDPANVYGPPSAAPGPSASSSSSAAIADTCDFDRPVTPREAASFSTRRAETPAGTTWPPPRPAPAWPGAGAPGTQGSMTRTAASGPPARSSRPGYPAPAAGTRCGSSPGRGHLPVARVQADLDIGVHHRLGELPDHLPQHVRLAEASVCPDISPEQARCHLRPLRSHSSLTTHLEGSRGGRFPIR